MAHVHSCHPSACDLCFPEGMLSLRAVQHSLALSDSPRSTSAKNCQSATNLLHRHDCPAIGLACRCGPPMHLLCKVSWCFASTQRHGSADEQFATIQGVGNFVNVAVIIILLVCFNQIKPGNGPGRAGHGYSVTYIQGGKKQTLGYKYRPNALSGMSPAISRCTSCVDWLFLAFPHQASWQTCCCCNFLPASHQPFCTQHPEARTCWGHTHCVLQASGASASALV